MHNQTSTAYFNRFTFDLPSEAVSDCSHQGPCDSDVEYWSDKIVRPDEITPDVLRDELRQYGAWDQHELSDDSANWQRLIWIAAGTIKEENNQKE